MSDLADFLLQRIGEDETLARMVTYTHHDWTAHAMADIAGCSVYDDQWLLASIQWYDHNRPLSNRPGATGPAYINSDRLAEHIARWDPARVLAECEAKRRIVGRHRKCGTGYGYCADLADLASVYADHPGYREEWRP